MMRLLVILSLTAAVPALAAVRPVSAAPRDVFADYVRGRAADDLGQLDVAARNLATAYDAQPGDRALALRTLRQAVTAGDMPLAVRVARGLDAAGVLPPDGTVLLFADAAQRRDWARATLLAQRIDQQRLFAFLTPVLRAWIGFAGHRSDAAALIDAGQAGPLSATLAAEHRVLLLLAGRDPAAGVLALTALNLPQGARAIRLRIAAASAIDRHDGAKAALPLLVGDDPATARARDLLAAGRPLPGAIDSAAGGIADLFARVATDVNREQAGTLALEFARMATWLAPDDSAGWLATASLLAGRNDIDASLAALDRIPADDPFAGTVRDARLTLLLRAGRKDDAFAAAKAGAEAADARSGDWARYGDMLTDRHDYHAASDAYAKALTRADDKAVGNVWPLLLQQANAQLLGGDWPAARASAERALVLAPQEPALLNFLGYSQLEHGGDRAAATALVAKASALAPDDPEITDSLGWSWYLRGDVARAIPLLERAARGAPAETEINQHLGDAYWAAGRRLEARYAWRAALVAANPAEAVQLNARIEGGPPART